MNWYYNLWVDAIQFENAKHGSFRNWKPYVMAGITFCQGLNLATILFWMSTWTKIRFFVPINFFPGSILNGSISGLITLFLPFIIINYFLIFKNKRYEELLKKYEHKNGKRYIIYFIGSFGVFIIPILIGFFIHKII
jgi:hypothetical protein